MGLFIAGITVGGITATPGVASQLTDAFVANVKPNVDFLDKSSRIAVDRSPSRAVRAYAQTVAARETIVANTLVAWWQANTPAGAQAALGTVEPGVAERGIGRAGTATPERDPLLPVGKMAGAVASGMTTLVDGSLLTGRSVALDVPAPVKAPAPPAARPLLPAQSTDLQTLSSLRGRRFDAFYELSQRNALRQLVALYRDYAATGDDPALRSLATLQLDKTNDLIRDLNRLR